MCAFRKLLSILQLTFRATAWVHTNKYCTNFYRDLAIYFAQVIEKNPYCFFFFFWRFILTTYNFI